MAVPCENEKQYQDLTLKSKKIKSDFFTDIDQMKIIEWHKKRDFMAIKNEYRRIINRHTDKPVKAVYFDFILTS
jgi:hypothetical protein